MTKSYSELLKDPRWQRKRLEIMERAGWMCDACSDSESTLHVHHGYYEKGMKPWEYPEESLHCLCKNCHDEVTDFMSRIKYSLGCVFTEDLENILGYIDGARNLTGASFEAGDTSWFRGVCVYFGADYEKAIDVAKSSDDSVTISSNQLIDIAIGKI